MNSMRCFYTLLMIFVPCILSAQTQLGLVRTAGTENEKGQPLEGVTVRAQGMSAVTSDAQGLFTLALSDVEAEGDVFRIVSARKMDYELLDKDALKADFVYSTSVPVEIVMISTKRLAQIREDIEEQARKNATQAYEKRLKELKEKLADLQITAKEYNDQTKRLQEKMESFERLILEMTEHYARTDYDRLDPLNAEINRCIVAGELERADSLIDTKGDVCKRAYDNIMRGQVIRQVEEEVEKIKQNYEADE